MKRKREIPEILNRGSLMTYHENGTVRCLGYLMEFSGRGIFEPTFGKLEVSSAEAKAHNQLLSRALIEGLDENCRVGVDGMFYLTGEGARPVVTTWTGEVVSQEVRTERNVITFKRKGMTFRGRRRRDQTAFFFKRIK